MDAANIQGYVWRVRATETALLRCGGLIRERDLPRRRVCHFCGGGLAVRWGPSVLCTRSNWPFLPKQVGT